MLYGPLSGMGGWAFERHNGVLSRVNNNRNSANISQTLLRYWHMQSRLLAITSIPAPDAGQAELLALNRIGEAGEEEGRRRLVPDSIVGGTRSMTLSKAASRAKMVDLEALNCYRHLLEYLHHYHQSLCFHHYLSTEPEASFVPPS